MYSQPIPLVAISPDDFSRLKTGDEIEIDNNGLLVVTT
jgi:hypothetical protein